MRTNQTLVYFLPTALLVAAVFLQASAQVADVYSGKMKAHLEPDYVHTYQRAFTLVPADKRLKFVPPLAAGTEVSAGDLIDARNASRKFSAMLVEPISAKAFLCSDLTGDGVIEESERFYFPISAEAKVDLDVLIYHPLENPFFKGYPVFVRYKRGFKHPQLEPQDRLLIQTVSALAYGNVSINGKNVLFQFPFTTTTPFISTTEGLFGVDVDGNGTIRNEQFSPETSYAASKEIVFRIGELYVSTSKVDLTKNEIVVRKRSKEEYLRHEIAVGGLMPDFSFVDFENAKRSLKDFRGKYVLVDFWGAWCIDCTRETPAHKEAMKRFRARGLDILSLNSDEDIAVAKKYLQENAIAWTQAKYDSIRTLIEDTYRIQEYPSTILLGPDGKVLVLDQDQLRGERLLQTLDKILPR